MAFAIDGHRAIVTLDSSALRINYTNVGGCCFPGVRSETLPLAEVLSAQKLPSTTVKWLWHPFAERTHRFVVYTFQRSARRPFNWHPRCLIFSTPAERVAMQWTALVNAAAAAQPRRPRHLLVLVNPFGGRRRGPQLYRRIVAPVFEKAGVKTDVRTTQFGGHARDLVLGELMASVMPCPVWSASTFTYY